MREKEGEREMKRKIEGAIGRVRKRKREDEKELGWKEATR